MLQRDYGIVQDLVRLEVPERVRLSPDAKHVVYSTKPPGKKDDHEVSTLWVAEVGKEKSARQLTSGLYNDRLPQWNSTGDRIAFLSDRYKKGESCALYAIYLSGGEPYPLTTPENKKPISEFRWSPNGDYIAYLSPDEITAEKKTKDEAKDDVQIYGAEWDYNRLRILNLSDGKVTVIFHRPAHVDQLAWSPASDSLVIAVQQTPDINSSTYHGLDFQLVSLSNSTVESISHFPGRVYSLELADNELFFVAGVTPNSWSTALAAYKLNLDNKEWCLFQYGKVNDAIHLVQRNGVFAVHVVSGLSDEIQSFDGSILYSGQHEIGAKSWDVAKIGPKTYILALVKSIASCPPEVFSSQFSGRQGTEDQLVKLSDHGSLLSSLASVSTEVLSCRSADGKVNLDGLYHSPTSKKPNQPWPTIVLIHGGPSARWTNRFGASMPFWAPAILSVGKYGVLIPNYRGSTSYGEKFAAYSRGNMGTLEYDDILTFVDEGIKLGLVDKERIIVGGWSQGGFLSYLCAVRNGYDYQGNEKGWSFKGAIPGAGVTDWDMMSMSSDAPCFESELAGKAPWETADKTDTSARRGSAVWEITHAKDKMPPLLILHGEMDERVPVSQAIAFHRGCLHYNLPCQMAIYPREPHLFSERTHILDMLKRVLEFCDLSLNGHLRN